MGVRKAILDKEILAADPEDHKSSVRCVTTIPLAAYTRIGNVITANANGALGPQDGLAMVQGNSLLLVTGASATDNGIYVVTQLGSGGAPFILTRRGDSDTNQFVNSGMRCGIEEGVEFGGRGVEFVLVTPNPIVLNTTALDFREVDTGGSGIIAEVTSPEVARIPGGFRSPIIAALSGTGAIGGEGILSEIDTDQNFTAFDVPIRSSIRIPARQQMLYKGIPHFDGLVIADGIVTDVAPSAPEILTTLEADPSSLPDQLGDVAISGTTRTTDATPKTIASAVFSNKRAGSMRLVVLGYDKVNDFTGHYVLEVTTKMVGGVVTILEDLFVKQYEDNINWDVVFSVVGAVVHIQVQGDVANNVEWRINGSVSQHG
jgi:hypothetical protein